MTYSFRVRVAGPLAPFAAGFRAELARQGYAWSSARERLQLMAQLSRWMLSRPVENWATSAG